MGVSLTDGTLCHDRTSTTLRMGMQLGCYSGDFTAKSFFSSPSLSRDEGYRTCDTVTLISLFLSVCSLLSKPFPLLLFSEPVGDCGLPDTPEASAGTEGREVHSPVPH